MKYISNERILASTSIGSLKIKDCIYNTVRTISVLSHATGLHGAPVTFQCMMDRLLDGLGDFVGTYLDDLVIVHRGESTLNTHDYGTIMWSRTYSETI